MREIDTLGRCNRIFQTTKKRESSRKVFTKILSRIFVTFRGLYDQTSSVAPRSRVTIYLGKPP